MIVLWALLSRPGINVILRIRQYWMWSNITLHSFIHQLILSLWNIRGHWELCFCQVGIWCFKSWGYWINWSQKHESISNLLWCLRIFWSTDIISLRVHLHMFSWRKMERGSDRILKQNCIFFSPFWSAGTRIKVCCTANPGNEYRNWTLSLLIIVIFEWSFENNGLCQVFKFRKGVK